MSMAERCFTLKAPGPTTTATRLQICPFTSRQSTAAWPHSRSAARALPCNGNGYGTSSSGSSTHGVTEPHPSSRTGPIQMLIHPHRPRAMPSSSAKTATSDASGGLRSTIAAVLAATIALTAPLTPPASSAALTAPLAAVSSLPSSTAAPITATPTTATPSQQQPIPASTAPSASVAPTTAVPSAASASAAALPTSLRFTGPEALRALPPLPTAFPPLPELRLPEYTTATLRNGLRVFLLPDPEVPLVRATLLMRGGQYGSPPDKVGLASLAASVQRAGGSSRHPGPSLDSRLEELAAAIEVGAGAQAVAADLSCLAEDVEEVMGLMAEVVRSPLLPPEQLSLYRSQLLNALQHRNDSPAAVARRKITQLLYGTDSLYARTPTAASVSAITPADLRAFVERWERPDAAVLGVVGAFQPQQMLALLEREWGDWAPARGQPPQPPEVPHSRPPALPPRVAQAAAAAVGVGVEEGGMEATVAGGEKEAGTEGTEGAARRRPVVYLVDRPGLTQANVVVGEPGIPLSDPAVTPLELLGGVFNSFGGQLFDTLRSREGLAYSVAGGWDSPPDHPGLFLAGGQTSSPGEFLRSLRRLLAAAAAQPPSAAQLAAARAEALNSFAFNFASSAAQLQRMLVYDLLGLPQDFLFRYFRGIEQVDGAAVQRAAAAHLHPGAQAVVVVADRRLAGPSLEAAGFEVVPLGLEDAEGEAA